MYMDVLIILAVTADVMFAAVACGASGIYIRPLSCAVMALVSSGFLIVSAFGSGLLFQSLPNEIIRWVGCVALVCIGLWQIVSCFGSALLCRVAERLPDWLSQLFAVHHDAAMADSDKNKTLSPSEAFVLAIPVSIDSLIGGLSISASGFGLVERFIVGFVCGYISVWFGSRAAARIPIRSENVRSVICGCLLIALGIWKRLA